MANIFTKSNIKTSDFKSSNMRSLQKNPKMKYFLWRRLGLFVSTTVFFTLHLFVGFAGTGCGTDHTVSEPTKVVFMAGFKPQANLPFVAAYVAQEKGYFTEQNLDVEILHSTGQHLQLLMAGEVDITTAAATSVLKRRSNPGVPIVAFVLFGQKGQQAFISLEKSGIRTIKDWEGKTFGFKISPPPDYLAMLKTVGADRSKITEVNAGFDPRVLTQGRVDILAVYKSNEPNIIRGMGFEVTTWDPEDYGIPNMGLTYITRETAVEETPSMLERFTKATLKATEYIISNEEEVLDIIMKYSPKEQRAHQRYMLNTELHDSSYITTEQNRFGWMSNMQWEKLYNHLFEFEALPNSFDYQTAYTTKILDAIYQKGNLIWP